MAFVLLLFCAGRALSGNTVFSNSMPTQVCFVYGARPSTLYVRRTTIAITVVCPASRISIATTGFDRHNQNKNIRLRRRRRRLDTRPTVAPGTPACVRNARFIDEYAVYSRRAGGVQYAINSRAMTAPRDAIEKSTTLFIVADVSMHYELYIGPSYTVFAAAAARIPVPCRPARNRVRDVTDEEKRSDSHGRLSRKKIGRRTFVEKKNLADEPPNVARRSDHVAEMTRTKNALQRPCLLLIPIRLPPLCRGPKLTVR